MVRGLLGLVVLCAGGCFFDSRMLQSKGLSPQHAAERRAAVDLMPAPIAQPGPPHPGPIRQLKARVWADASYRRRMHWREHLEALFDRANEYLRHALAVELVPDIRPWDRDAEVADLETFLQELARMDPGDGVDHVMGLTAALPRVSVSHEAMGRAWAPGKHLAMRAMNDAMEREELKNAFPTLSRSELDELHEARTMHKEVAVLVHEWSHNLGALHEDGRDWLMSPGYHHQAGRLSDANLRVIELGLAARSGDPAAVEAQRRFIADTDWSWDRRERNELLQVLGGGGVPSEPSGSEPGVAPAGEETAIETAEAQREAGKRREALSTLDGARAHLSDGGDGWLRLAQAYARLGAYQRAGEALSRAGTGPEIASARAVLDAGRRQRSIFGVPADDEPEATALLEQAHEVLFDNDGAARRLVDRGLARWPKHAGLLALRCGLLLQAGQRRAAEQDCNRALKVSDEAMLAHYFAAHAALRGGRRPEAIAHFERTIALDPEARVAYENLATLYKTGGNDDKLARLRADYQARFHQPLR